MDSNLGPRKSEVSTVPQPPNMLLLISNEIVF